MSNVRCQICLTESIVMKKLLPLLAIIIVISIIFGVTLLCGSDTKTEVHYSTKSVPGVSFDYPVGWYNYTSEIISEIDAVAPEFKDEATFLGLMEWDGEAILAVWTYDWSERDLPDELPEYALNEMGNLMTENMLVLADLPEITMQKETEVADHWAWETELESPYEYRGGKGYCLFVYHPNSPLFLLFGTDNWEDWGHVYDYIKTSIQFQ